MNENTLANVTQYLAGGKASRSETDTPRLLAVSGPLTGSHFAIVTDPVVIGRAPTCSICLDTSNVSRQHCSVVRDSDGGLSIVDNHSTNGTTVNSRPLKPGVRRRLHHGDTIHVCDSGFFFLCPKGSLPSVGDAGIEIDLGAAAQEADGFLAGQPDILSLRQMRKRRQ
ncbi:MAG: FHA domain-containing protein [Planctomycetota bacterium]|jgi:pSer/pThr/pTyr-binding forkhead associated (FHA) protein